MRKGYSLTKIREILKMTTKAIADFEREREEISEVYCK
jgi:hypothetical protein